MDETALTQQDKDSRALALEECQRRILEALRKGLQAYKTMSRELTTIQDKELYRAQGFERFDDYCRRNFKFEMRDVNRIHSIATTVILLERQGLTLPENEAQVLELTRLEPEKRGAVWQKMLSLNEREDIPLTSDFIRKAVEKESGSGPARPGPKPRAARGVDVSLDLGSASDGATARGSAKTASVPTKERISLTARGEAALTRLRALCGDSLADALERGSLPMAERDIIRWGEESDAELVRNLVYYVAHLRWTLAKALAYEARLVNGDTTVDELITLARARNGRVAAKHLDARIVTEILQAT